MRQGPARPAAGVPPGPTALGMRKRGIRMQWDDFQIQVAALRSKLNDLRRSL